MTTEMLICLAIFVFMIGGFVLSDKIHISLGVIAFATIVITAYSGLVEPKTILSNFGNTNVMLITGMYIVSAGFNRTQAVKKMSSLVYKVSSGNFTIMLAGYCLVIFLLSQFIPSPVACFTIVAPMLAASCEEFNVSPSKAMFSLGLVGVGTCGVLPVGAGAVGYATNNGYLESYGYTAYQFQLLDTFKARFVVAIVIILYAVFVAPKFSPDQPSVPITLTTKKASGGKEVPPLSPVREFLGYAVFIITTLGLIFQSQLGIPTWQIAFTGAAVVMLTGVLTAKETVNALPIRILIMLVAALTVGGAMVSCGLGDLIGGALANVLNGMTSKYAVGALFFIIPFALTQVMQNQSVSQIFRPIAILTCKAMGCSPIGPLLLMNAACLTAFLTPMATGTIPPMMDAGGYNQADLFKMGWLPSIIIAAISVFWTMTIFPLFP